jgi:DNA-binding XRE family transcriptional regulator
MISKAGAVDVKALRSELGLSQTEFAALLAVSPRTIQSTEQGWRRLSSSVERMALLLAIAHRHGAGFGRLACWKTKHCAPECREACPAYWSRQGHLCWFMTGTVCGGRRLRSWEDKKLACARCAFFLQLVGAAPAPR